MSKMKTKQNKNLSFSQKYGSVIVKLFCGNIHFDGKVDFGSINVLDASTSSFSDKLIPINE